MVAAIVTFRKILASDVLAFREMFLRSVSALPPGADLTLSGGTDSTVTLFALLELGRKPRCITFKVAGIESSDVKAARKLTRHFNLELVEVEIGSDVDSMVRDIRRVLPFCHKIKKTNVQTMIPWLYICPAMKGDDVIMSISADDHYCLPQSIQRILREKGEDAIMHLRYTDQAHLDYTTSHICRIIREGFGKEVHDPYFQEEQAAFFRQFSVDDLHRPFQKHISVRAFSEYFQQGQFYRQQESYQVACGLRDLHATRLLNSELHNPDRMKDAAAVYRRLKPDRSLLRPRARRPVEPHLAPL